MTFQQNNELPKTTPSIATVSIFFDYDGIRDIDFGLGNTKFEFKAMINGGYIVRATITDFKFEALRRLIKSGYFKEARKRPTYISFFIRDGSGEKVENLNVTKKQKAILLSINVKTKAFSASYIEFIAIDPASWYLNRGAAGGEVYKGKLSEAIKQVINAYSFGQVEATITETLDSEQNKWYMMRMDPKTWIGSIMEWSSSITKTKTNFIIESDGLKFYMREQGLIPSKERGYFEAFTGVNEVRESDLMIDNALSMVEAKLLTHGLSAVSGMYLENVPVDDSKTTKKQLARISKNDESRGLYYSFNKPDLSPNAGNASGFSRVDSIPEIYSGGEIGLSYEEYMDGRARGLYLSMVNNLVRTRIKVRGQASFFDSMGLGVDTVFVLWKSFTDEGTSSPYWYTGNWLLYGFNHVVEKGSWTTDLYLSRFDADAEAVKNPRI